MIKNQSKSMGGHRPGAGRPKGSRNRRTAEVRETFERFGCDPIAELIAIARRAEVEGNLPLAVQAYVAMCPFYAPKLKALDVEAQLSGEPPIIQVSTGIDGDVNGGGGRGTNKCEIR